MRFAFSTLKLVTEPGGAVALAALLAGKAPPCAGARPAMASRLGEAAHAACTASVKETTWFGCGFGFGFEFGFGFGFGLGIGLGFW